MMMASAQNVETSVNTNNSPSQDYTTNPDDHSNHNKASLICVVRELKSTDPENLNGRFPRLGFGLGRWRSNFF